MSLPADTRVLVLVPDLNLTGGVAHYYATLALDARPGIDYFRVNRAGAETMAGKILHRAAGYVRFVGLILLRRYQLVHVNPSFNARSFYRDGLFVWLARRMHRPILVTMHGWDDDFERRVAQSRVRRWFFRATFGRAQGFIVLGSLFERRLRALGVPEETPVWVDTTVTEPATVEATRPAGPDGSIRVLFMARVLREKGVLVAIDAVAEARARLPQRRISLVIAGDGPDLEQAAEHVRRMGLDDVEFTGYVRGVEKQRLLAEADIFLLPTWHGEGLPCAVLEAMAHGLVVITRPVGGIPEVIVDGEHGFLVESTDPTAFAEVLRRVAADDELRARIAAANRRAARRFEKDAVVQRVLEVQAAVLSRAAV